LQYYFANLTLIGLLLAVALFYDLKWRRVPNWLVLISLVLGLALGVISNSADGAWFSFLGMLVALAFFLPPYLFGWLGAGDVKLFCALGALLGPWGTVLASLYTALAGGVVVICWAIYQIKVVDVQTCNIANIMAIKNCPYVLAIFVGTLAAVAQIY
jgi:prepilin peptidase CpaA